MRLRTIAALCLALAASGCATYDRGTLSAASTRAVAIPMRIIEPEVEGRSCATVETPRYALAVANALEQAPEANALLNASYEFDLVCVVVRGTAVALPEPGAAPPVAPDAELGPDAPAP